MEKSYERFFCEKYLDKEKTMSTEFVRTVDIVFYQIVQFFFKKPRCSDFPNDTVFD